MSDIHLHTPGGETVVRTEERVVELLQGGELAESILFWRSGMADWEPIANFAPAQPAPASPAPTPATQRLPDPAPSGEQRAEAVARAQRKSDSAAKPMPEIKPRPAAAAPAARAAHVTGRRRFNFRRDPEPLTTILQVMLVVCICLAGLELAQRRRALQLAGRGAAVDPRRERQPGPEHRRPGHRPGFIALVRWQHAGRPRFRDRARRHRPAAAVDRMGRQRPARRGLLHVAVPPPTRIAGTFPPSCASVRNGPSGAT